MKKFKFSGHASCCSFIPEHENNEKCTSNQTEYKTHSQLFCHKSDRSFIAVTRSRWWLRSIAELESGALKDGSEWAARVTRNSAHISLFTHLRLQATNQATHVYKKRRIDHLLQRAPYSTLCNRGKAWQNPLVALTPRLGSHSHDSLWHHTSGFL